MTPKLHPRLAILLVLAAAAVAPVWSESANPFTSSGGPSAQPAVEGLGGPVAAIVAAMAPLLHVLSDRLAELTRSVKGASGPGPLIALLLVSLVYGAFHALGPGHGKTLVSTFFIARDAKLRHSLVAGYLIAIVHALSALTLVALLFFLIHGFFSSNFEAASRMLRTVSFGLIAVLGGFMLVRRSLGVEHSHGHGRGPLHDRHPESAADHDDHVEGPAELRTRDLWGVALASGLVPCPGASAVILLSLSLNMILVSVLAVTMISVGMGLTVSAIGAIAILAKKGVIGARGQKDRGERKTLRRVIEIAGSAALFLFGIIFFLTQL